MKINDIIERIEKKVPLSLAYLWDNSGFLIGDIKRDIKKVFITLDVNKKTVDEAVKCGAELIISHHPIMMGSIKKIDYSEPLGYVIKELIKNDIALYAAHTNMDTVKGGINDILAEKLGIYNTEIIEYHTPDTSCGLGRVGNLENETTLECFAQLVKEKLNTPFVRIMGDKKSIIKRAGVGGGSCSDSISTAIKMGADVFVTADLKYHIAIDSVESGICVIDAGHFPTEVFVIEIFEKLLCDMDIEIYKSHNCDIFEIL